jgi:transposase
MAKPYSNDFRQKVIEAIELNGLKKTEASQLFNISRNTINLWCRRKAQTGDVQPQTKPTSSQVRKIQDWDKFVAFVKAHGEKTQSQMAQLWSDQISQPTISRALKKLEYTRKKKLMGISNAVKLNEQHF